MKFLQCIVLLCLWTAAVAEFVDSDATCSINNGQCETRCTCNEGYTHMNEKCIAKVDKACNSSIENACIANAECKVAAGNDSVCKCRNKYSMYKNNSQCSGDVGAECKDSSDCTVHSECRTSGTCACMDKYTSSSDNKTCIGYVGAECDDVSQCIDHAVCSGRKCKCADDYEGDKICKKKDTLPLPRWAIILIAVGGGIFLIGLIVLIIYCCCCRRRRAEE
ncbi:hypothetical protein MAR_014293 [Mya arenaria]|uniref:EGF-like domain-containing protein n=1 Tax=Mya arenaria TaxID=6604 RepID=A0ABY7G523_MYAAR|nr:hypothetical protein MAR_014293 [Mya arenaria]